MTFPVELESGQYIEFRSTNDCRVYGAKGEVVGSIQPRGEVPILRGGESEIHFDCGVDSSVKVRARVTVISQDQQTLGKSCASNTQ